MVKIIKVAPICFGSHVTIIREPYPMLRENYISGSNVLVVTTTRTLLPDM